MASTKTEQPVASPQRSAGAQASIPLLYMALDEAYDRPRKRYKEGHSDETIAKETGLSVDFVRKRREDDFGPLTDTRLEELERENAALKTELAQANDRVNLVMRGVVNAISALNKVGAV